MTSSRCRNPLNEAVTRSRRFASAAAAVVLLLAACGGGGGGIGSSDTPTPIPPPPANSAPIASIRADLDVRLDSALTLDGRNSTDPEGNALSYRWSVESRPPGSRADLASTSEGTTSFQPDIEGSYKISLVVSDGVLTSRAASHELFATSRMESIVVAVNQSYVQRAPDWRQRIDVFIASINAVFRKTTAKRYAVAKYMTYEDLDYERTWNDPSYYVKSGDSGATTIIAFLHPNDWDAEDTRRVAPSNIFNVTISVSFAGITHETIILMLSEAFNFLIRPGEPGYRADLLATPLHELGHANGLAVPDWYLYASHDCTRAAPTLPRLDLRDRYPNEPMLMGGSDGVFEFSPFNSSIIDLNIDRKYTYADINQWHAARTRVRVVDAISQPVQGAVVRVYGIRKSCFYCHTVCEGYYGVSDSTVPLQAVTTDQDGYALYDGPTGTFDFNEAPTTGWLVKALKVEHSGRGAASYSTFLGRQEAHMIDNLDTSTTVLRLE